MHKFSATALAIVVAAGMALSVSPDAATATPGSTLHIGRKGFDRGCAAGIDKMDTIWHNTSYFYNAVYIGGANYSDCGVNVDAGWIRHNVNEGWSFLPIWVGPQAPCSSNAYSHFSLNPPTAHDQGENAAQLAVSHAIQDLDFNPDVPIVYDLEGYTSYTEACEDAVKAFMRGWVSQMHSQIRQTSGVYGSCSSELNRLYGSTPNPDFIWVARPDEGPNTKHISCIPNNHWDGGHRHKQYEFNVAIPVANLANNDKDCANGPVYGVTQWSNDTDCVPPG